MTGVIVKAETDGWEFEVPPCLCCPHVARCRAGQACAAFSSFVAFGGRRWSAEKREPSATLYRRIFPQEARGVSI
jgi:hypothetical protein